MVTESHTGDQFDFDRRTKSATQIGAPIELGEQQIQLIFGFISPYYQKGCRHSIIYSLCGLFCKYGVSLESTINVIQTIAKDDEERKSRLTLVQETYKKNREAVSGRTLLLEILGHATADKNIAKEILQRILQAIGAGQNPVLWLTHAIMQEYAFKSMTDNEDIYYYDNEMGVYVAGQEWRIKDLSQLMYPEIRTRELQEVINQIKRRTYLDRSSFDSNTDILNLKNGLLNVHTLEFREHTSDYLSLVQLPIKYDPDAKCPNILKFYGQVLKPKYVFTAAQLFGYCLYKTAKYEKAVMCVGKGNNGKSTFLKLFEHFLGIKNVSHASLQELNGDKFAIADLSDKLANICADLKSDKLPNTGVFKMLVSGDVIRAQKKHGQPFDFANYAKLIYSTNQIPESSDITYAYFKRWIILIFERIFINDDKDTRLIDKMTTDTELSGLLNLALIALRQLIKDNGFIHTDDIETVEREYNLNANTVERFLADKCAIDASNRESFEISRDIYHGYIVYCKDNKITPLADNAFGMELAQRHVMKERKMLKGSREHCYVGISLLNSK